MQMNEAYNALTESTSGNEYDTVPAPRAQSHCTDVNSTLPANNKATSSRQRMLPLWGMTTAFAIVTLIFVVVGVILSVRPNQDILVLQQELISLKETLASIQKGEKLKENGHLIEYNHIHVAKISQAIQSWCLFLFLYIALFDLS